MTSKHRLDPLLKPASIALLGASARDGSPGHILAAMMFDSDFAGGLYPVNRGYAEILGQPCYPDLESLPECVDQVVIALGNAHLEAALAAAARHGARAATIYSSGVLADEAEPRLLERLRAIASEAGMQICGVNGMGFYNPGAGVYAGIFPRPRDIVRGGISYIAQSGSAFAALCHNGCRLGFNLCVSTGNELVTGTADYIDWSLAQPDTRVIGLFLETVRDPAAFTAVLEKADREGVPVVALKLGKSPQAAAMALTHTGAIAGSHAAFEALCRRYGVIEVDSLDEMAATLMLLQTGREIGAGGFAAIFESGGLRELISDHAHAMGLDFAPLETATTEALKQHLDPGLKAENPLDAWGSHERFDERLQKCVELVVRDPNVAACTFVSNFRDGYFLSEAIYRIVEAVGRDTAKPLALANSYSDLANESLCRRGREAGIPIIDGTQETLRAFKHLFAWRDFRQRRAAQAPRPQLPRGAIERCDELLDSAPPGALDESAALQLLDAFAIPVASHQLVANADELEAAASHIGFPLVLKTAASGVAHKSDSRGVFVDLRNATDLARCYTDLSTRLGPQALLAEMIDDGVEIGLGTIRDPQFGPLLMISAGGIMIELLDDRAVALCPVDAGEAEALLTSLKVDRLLRGARGAPAANRTALVELIVRLSWFAWQFREHIAEIDVNPVLAGPRRATAVDALIVVEPRDGS